MSWAEKQKSCKYCGGLGYSQSEIRHEDGHGLHAWAAKCSYCQPQTMNEIREAAEQEAAALQGAYSSQLHSPTTPSLADGGAHTKGMKMDIEKIKAALKALRNYEQADEDGVMVLASRQAIEEVAAFAYAALEAQPVMAVDRNTVLEEVKKICWKFDCQGLIPHISALQARALSQTEPKQKPS